MLKKGDWCKHFKGTNLDEKNIYIVLATGVTYSGDNSTKPLVNLVVYKNVFQNKIFVREIEDLIAELPKEKQEMYGQVHRVDKLTEEEIDYVKTKLESMGIVDY